MPERGEVWLAALDPVGQGEQGGTRAVLVVSTNAFSAWPVGLVIVVPITTRDRGFVHHIAVAGGGLDRPSFAMPEYVRSVAQRRLQRRLGAAEQSSITAVDDWLRRLTGFVGTGEASGRFTEMGPAPHNVHIRGAAAAARPALPDLQMEIARPGYCGSAR